MYFPGGVILGLSSSGHATIERVEEDVLLMTYYVLTLSIDIIMNNPTEVPILPPRSPSE